MSPSATDLTTLRESISKQRPSTTGTYPLTDNTRLLFFHSGNSTSCIDLAIADDPSLQILLDACEPDNSGDDSSKAMKMDKSKFLTRLNVHDTGIAERVGSGIFPFDLGIWRREIRAELDKLNVYGPGSSFKSRTVSDRHDSPFGWLIVLFSTRHEGGTIRFGRKDCRPKHWNTFESTPQHISTAHANPSISYVGFSGYLEHEVSMVTSGYLVTLTYKLCDKYKPTFDRPHLGTNEDENALCISLSTLLNNRTLLPEGGYLGFALHSQTHLVNANLSSTPFNFPNDFLTGSDAILMRVLQYLNLKPMLKIIYDDDNYQQGNAGDKTKIRVMLNGVKSFPDSFIEGPLWLALHSESGGEIICDAGEEGLYKFDTSGSKIQAKKVQWVTQQNNFSRIKSFYITDSGQEEEFGYCYGTIYLMAEIPAPAKRIRSTKRQRVR